MRLDKREQRGRAQGGFCAFAAIFAARFAVRVVTVADVQVLFRFYSEVRLNLVQRKRRGLPETELATRIRLREVPLDTQSTDLVGALKVTQRDLRDPGALESFQSAQDILRRRHLRKGGLQRLLLPRIGRGVYPEILFANPRVARTPLHFDESVKSPRFAKFAAGLDEPALPPLDGRQPNQRARKLGVTKQRPIHVPTDKFDHSLGYNGRNLNCESFVTKSRASIVSNRMRPRRPLSIFPLNS